MKKINKITKKNLPKLYDGDIISPIPGSKPISPISFKSEPIKLPTPPKLGTGDKDKNNLKYDLSGHLSNLSNAIVPVGAGLNLVANQPGEYSNETMSGVGMGLQGLSAGLKMGGIPGAILGGIGGLGMGLYSAKAKNIAMDEAEQMKMNAYMSNSTVDPTKGIFKKGGKVKDKSMENTDTYYSQLVKDKNDYIIPQMFGQLNDKEQGVPLIHIQAEKGEKAIFSDGGIVDVKAKKSHEQMDSDDVTDIFPEGTYIASQRKKQNISKEKAEKHELGHTPVVYNEFENIGEPEAVKFSDIFSKKEHSPAELAEIIKNKYKLLDKKSDIFSQVTNDENRIGRMPYLMKLVELKQGKKKNNIAKKSNNVEKYAESDYVYDVNPPSSEETNSLESLYKNYGEQMNQFNDKYQQKYSDYYKYARGANAGANILGAAGIALQSSAVNPGYRSTRYADQMFQEVPNYLRNAGMNEAYKGIYSLGRNLSALDTPTSTLTGRLAPMIGNAIGQNNQQQMRYNMDNIQQARNKGQFLQNTENYNSSAGANAENQTTRFDNYKLSQVAGFGGRTLTGDASLRGKELQTQMGIERNKIDSPFSMAAQMAQLKMMQAYQNKMFEDKNGKNETRNESEPFNTSQSNNQKTVISKGLPEISSYYSSFGDASSAGIYKPEQSSIQNIEPNEQEKAELLNFSKDPSKYSKDSVLNIQKMLKESYGYPIKVDGIFGTQTKKYLDQILKLLDLKK